MKMGFNKKCEEFGVSPVIGVILVVAITVILAALIGLMVLGFGDTLGEVGTGNQNAFELNEKDGTITPVTMGDKNLEIRADGETISSISSGDVGKAIKLDDQDAGTVISVVNPETEEVLQEWTVTEEFDGSSTPEEVLEAMNDSSILIANSELDENKPEEDRYKTITDAVNNYSSSEHNKILVRRGTYTESIYTKDRNILIDGIDNEEVIVTSSSTAFKAFDNLEVQDMTISNADIGINNNKGCCTTGTVHATNMIFDGTNNEGVNGGSYARTIIRDSRILGSVSGVDAKQNWWGEDPPSGVRTGSSSWDRWCTNKDCSSLSEKKLSGGDTGRDYTTIQGAIDDGSKNIDLQANTEFNENVDLNMNGITIEGAGESTVVSPGSGDAFFTWDNNIEIRNLRVENSDVGFRHDFDCCSTYSATLENVTFASSNSNSIVVSSEQNDVNLYVNESKILSPMIGDGNTDASYNWWGSSSGPETGDYSGGETVEPYCTNESCTDFSSS